MEGAAALAAPLAAMAHPAVAAQEQPRRPTRKSVPVRGEKDAPEGSPSSLCGSGIVRGWQSQARGHHHGVEISVDEGYLPR